MFSLFVSGGWLMLPILGCSIVALAIIIERFIALRPKKVMPEHILPMVLHNLKNQNLNYQALRQSLETSALGEILARGLLYRAQGPEVMKQKMEEAGRHLIFELESFLNSLGTIAAIAPLLGLLGTVIGMIKMFCALTLESGTVNVQGLAGGISQALLTTAFGLGVAIPSVLFHRFFHNRIDELAIGIEKEALKMIEGFQKVEQKMDIV